MRHRTHTRTQAVEGTLLPEQAVGSVVTIWDLNTYDYSPFRDADYPPHVRMHCFAFALLRGKLSRLLWRRSWQRRLMPLDAAVAAGARLARVAERARPGFRNSCGWSRGGHPPIARCRIPQPRRIAC